MDPITLARVLWWANKALGDRCPSCDASSWVSQEQVGETWWSHYPKIKCGHCGEVFVVKPGPE